MNELIAQLLHLAALWTGYPEPSRPPLVQVVSSAEIHCPCAGLFLYAKRIPGYGVTIDIPARLLLRKDVDLDTALGQSVLLHELVHALQGQEGPAVYGTPLWYWREREAHRVQLRFLRSSGVSLHGQPEAWRDD